MNTTIEQVSILVSAIEKAVNIKMYPSPLSLLIKDNTGMFTGYYAFYRSGAIRVEVSGDEIIGVSIWNKVGSLNKPSYRVSLRGYNPLDNVDILSRIVLGKGTSLMRASMFESKKLYETAKQDIDAFMKSIGGFAYNKPLEKLYLSYNPWAEVNNKKPISASYFYVMAKDWLVSKGKGRYSNIAVTTQDTKEVTQVNEGDLETFELDIIHNDLYYKVDILDKAIRKLAQDDPLIPTIFICGSPGFAKTSIVKQTLLEEEVWDEKVVYVNGGIHGFAELLTLLWRNRVGKIVVMDECDKLINPDNVATLKIIKQALRTVDSDDRTITYERSRRR